MEREPLMRSSLGLNNRVDSLNLRRDREDGSVELSLATNITHDQTGRISRRLGQAATAITSASHSLFYESGVGLFVTGDAFSILHEDNTSTAIRSVSENRAMSYCQIGDIVFYCNGIEAGYVRSNLSHSWIRLEDPKFRDQAVVTIPIPIGHIVGHHGGRVLIGSGSNVWITDTHSPNVLRKDHVMRFPMRVTMIQSTPKGCYIGTQGMVYFFPGGDITVAPEIKASKEPPIPGTDTTVEGNNLMFGKYGHGILPMWTTRKGVYAGTHDGTCVNLTADRLTLPTAIEGCSYCTRDRYVASIGSGISTGSKIAVVMELGGGRLSQFLNYDFDSFAIRGDEILGANDSGIFTLETGDLDVTTQILAKFALDNTNFGVNKDKIIESVTAFLRADGNLRFTIERDNEDPVWRDFVPKNKRLAAHAADIDFGRDCNGTNFKLEVQNLQGSDFTIASLDALVRVIGRKLEMGV